jgi:hypothetical protein
MNPLLTKIQQDLRAKVELLAKKNPRILTEYDKAIEAGKIMLFDKKTHAHMEMVKNPDALNDPVKTISTGIAGLTWLMYQQSKKTMKPEVMIMSATALMCEAFDFAERGKGLQLTPAMIAQTTRLLAEKLFAKLGITPEQLQQAIATGHDEIQASQQGKQGLLSKPIEGAA